MKSKILFSLFVCLLLGVRLSAQCSADIVYSQNVASPVVSFWTDSVPNDSLLLGAYSYSWTFGDGTGGSGHQTIHTYPVAATTYYYVCLTKYDTITQCTSTTCDSVLVSGTNCSTSITYTNVDSLYSFSDSTTGVAPFSYDWTINGSSVGSSSSSSVTAILNDSLGRRSNVCIIVTDATGCQSTTCISADTVATPSCANFSTSISYSPNDSLYTFLATNANAVGVCSYTWTYDNVNEGYASSIALVMPNSYHTVCVYVTDSLGCNTSACVGLVDSTYGPNCGTTINYTTFDSLYTFATVNSGVAPFTYSWTINGRAPGNNTSSSISAVLDSAGAFLSACVIVTDAAGCIATDCATAIDSAGGGGGSCQAGFTIVADTASADTGTYIGYNTSTGSYGSDILWSFGDGTTSTSPYPSHTYATAGLYTICLTVGTPGTSCYSTYCDSSFYVSRSLLLMSQFIVMPPAGIQTVSGDANTSIYPNPVSDVLNISTVKRIDQERIINTEGQVLFESATGASQIDVSKLSSGIYILELNAAGNVSRVKFVKD